MLLGHVPESCMQHAVFSFIHIHANAQKANIQCLKASQLGLKWTAHPHLLLLAIAGARSCGHLQWTDSGIRYADGHRQATVRRCASHAGSLPHTQKPCTYPGGRFQPGLPELRWCLPQEGVGSFQAHLVSGSAQVRPNVILQDSMHCFS